MVLGSGTPSSRMTRVVEVRPNAYPAPSWGAPRATISAPAEAIFTSRVPATSFVHRRSPDLPSAPDGGSAPDPDPAASMATANAATVPSTILRIGGLLPDSGGLDGADVDSVRRSAPGPSGRDERRVRPQWSSPRIVEPELPRRMPAGPPPALVDEAVVGVAQEHQVVQVGGPAIGPVDQVVGVQPPLALASGEPAGCPITVSKYPEDLTRDGPAPPADAHRAALALQDPLDPAVAGQPADCLGREALAPLGLCQPRTPSSLGPGQGLRSSVDHHRGRLGLAGGHIHQGISESSASGVNGLRVSGDSLGSPGQSPLEGRPLLGRKHPLQPQYGPIVVPIEVEVPAPPGLLCLLRERLLVPPGLPPQPRRPAVRCLLRPPGGGLRGGERGQGPELVPGQPSGGGGVGDPGEPLQGVSHPHPHPGRSPPQAVPGR